MSLFLLDLLDAVLRNPVIGGDCVVYIYVRTNLLAHDEEGVIFEGPWSLTKSRFEDNESDLGGHFAILDTQEWA